MTDYTITQQDKDAWEIYGPAIFYEDMTGPATLARYRHTCEEDLPDSKYADVARDAWYALFRRALAINAAMFPDDEVPF